ncbi:hypothetical protein NP493_798g00008 [Ridgeia piscesae]|uniref:Uncharacterized protein n=1 Tax=Ridgeia piscesae TaxID=27915 RepID=A0AAD9NLK9_RIDPI|nr:hypothetical protein NP493_798g00008 [Ridgeia piscesae]
MQQETINILAYQFGFLTSSRKSSSCSCVSVYPLSFHLSRRASRVRASAGPFGTPRSRSRIPFTGNFGGIQLLNSVRMSRQFLYLRSSQILSFSLGSLPAASQTRS